MWHIVAILLFLGSVSGTCDPLGQDTWTITIGVELEIIRQNRLYENDLTSFNIVSLHQFHYDPFTEQIIDLVIKLYLLTLDSQEMETNGKSKGSLC